jgi:hypothetical protein
MSGSRSRAQKAGRVSVSGPWAPLPLDLLRSRRMAELSPYAAKLLLDLISQFRSGDYGNGDVAATFDGMRVRGWTSKATLQAALRELLDSGLLIVTRQGGRRVCTLYALTPWPLHCDLTKLDCGPGAYSTNSWRADPVKAASPTVKCPANWNSPRRNANPAPAAVSIDQFVVSLRGQAPALEPRYGPVMGPMEPKQPEVVAPLRVTYLDKPSASAREARVA